MAEQAFYRSAVCTLLALGLLAASASGTKLKSSGIHLIADSKNGGFTTSPRHRRDVSVPESGGIEVQQFHVNSTLYARFATVTINSEVLNTAEEGSQEVNFQVQVPEAAFMSNFTMVVDGQVYLSEVLEKKAAEERYREARERNQTAGQVKQEPVKLERGMELFTVNINVAAQGTASFTLIYNELLERRRGVYKQTLVVQPSAVVYDMSISASFAERQGFTYFAYTLPGSENRLTASSTKNKTQMKASINSRELVFRPSLEMQRSFDPEQGIHGEFTVYYKVNNEPEGGSIIVQNDYFAHFFAPPDLDPLPKNILFIIDISGSMSGEKINQARDAMLKILDDLKTRSSDQFNILLFDDRREVWQESPASTLGSEIERAKTFVREKLVSRGGTDIHSALMKGLFLLLGDQESRSCDVADMIIFLTDGDPTSGITDTDRIISDVTARNKGRAFIHSLGFGFNLNFAFLSKLSLRNQGLVHRIYAEGDAKDQLRDFYKEISTPVLCDVVAHYSTDVVDTDLLTVHVFPLFFEGKEIVVAGKMRMLESNTASWDAEVQGTGPAGLVDFVVPAGKVQLISEPWLEKDLTEKFWAYMKIKSLLRELDSLDSEADRNRTHAEALNMSLTYGFVTPLTSFSIVAENTGQDGDRLESFARGKSRPTSNMNNQYLDKGMGPTGKACTLRWCFGTVWCLLIVWLILQ